MATKKSEKNRAYLAMPRAAYAKKQEAKEQVSKEQRRELAQYVIDSLASDEPRRWSMSWNAAALMPHNPITGNRYKGINRAYLSLVSLIREYDDPRWFTFNEIAKHDGWTLRKGSKGARVEKWTLRHSERERKDADGNVMLDEDGNAMVRVYSWMQLQSVFPVFNGSCIEGLEPMEFAPKGDEELFEIADRLIKLIRLHGKYSETMRGEAFFSPTENKVHLPRRDSFDTARDFVATLAHEFAHATQAATRMGRVNGDESDHSYAFEELVAEMSALFIQADLGFDSFGSVTENSLAYLQSWARRATADDDTVAKVAQAITTAQQVADWIMALYWESYGDKKEKRAA